MSEQVKCPFCASLAVCSIEDSYEFYGCPVCGRFELKYPSSIYLTNLNHTASYLAYHAFSSEELGEYRYHTVRDKEYCDKNRQEFNSGHNIAGLPVHLDMDIVENWYPKNFAERVDYILSYLYQHTKHIGQPIYFTVNLLLSVLFVDKQEIDQTRSSGTYGRWIERDYHDYANEVSYMLKFLKQKAYIETDEFSLDSKQRIVLTPEGYARVDELQKNTSHGRQVLVAMKFGEDTKPLREAIRQGVKDAGYMAVFIDEVQHNELITPELLKHIRDSKFVVADLTHQNNGAYFEEGYAMGLGKPVIQLCKTGTRLHFDIAQKNTIMWETEDDIPERLKNRIIATID